MALVNSWRLVGSLSFSQPKKASPRPLVKMLNSRVIKVKTMSATPNAWRRAAYMKQVIGQVEVSNRMVPLNQETIFLLSPLADQYGLIFTPVMWLPNLVVRVWEYTGAIDSLPWLIDQNQVP